MAICGETVVNHYPRILTTLTGGINTLNCSNLEWDRNDDVYFRICDSNPHIAHIAAIDKDYGDTRNFLYSKSKPPSEKRLLTMSGYLFDGRVDVRSWKERYSPDDITPQDKEPIGIINQVEMIHVTGFKNALAKHKERIEGLDLDLLSLDDVVKTYHSILFHIPSH